MKVGLDNKQFNKELDKFKRNFVFKADSQLRFAAFQVYRKVREHAPVDRGDLRDSVTISRNFPKASTGGTVFSGSVAPDPRMGPIYVSTNKPYGPTVEYGLYPQPGTNLTVGGYSRKAPRGMFRLAVLEVAKAFNVSRGL